MQKLTKAEEEVMQYLWQLTKGTVSQLIEAMPEPKPPHSTISSIVRILERKGAVDHNTYGRTHEYYPLISREDYSQGSLQQLAQDYFGGSLRKMVSFLVQSEDLSIADLEEIRKKLKEKTDDQ